MHLRWTIFFLTFAGLCRAASPCDLNGDNQVNVVDVQLGMNQALGGNACGSADLDLDGRCDVVDVQLLINAAIGGQCQASQTPLPISGTALSTYGVKCDGATNDRAAIQRAFDDASKWSNKTLVFPSGRTCIVNSTVTLTGSGWTIEGRGATIKAANGMSCTSGNGVVHLSSPTNFTINDLDTDGNRANRTVTENFSAHSWNIRGAQNGTFRNVDWINGCADNVRLGPADSSDTDKYNKNLTFIDSTFKYAFRDNVSVITGWNIRFLGTCSGGFSGTCTCQMIGAHGTNPQTGIKWEPNNSNASPAVDEGLVDGCLLAENSGAGWGDSTKSDAQNLTLRNSIVRNNGSSGDQAAAGVIVSAKGGLFENNWIGKQAGARFGVVYISSGRRSSKRRTEVRNNRIDGPPPIGEESGRRLVVWYGNFTDGTAMFHSNTITNGGTGAGGGWCSDAQGLHDSSTANNILNSTLQSPNPGCR